MGVLQKVRGLSLFDKIKSTDFCQFLNLKPQLLHIDRLRLRWNGHVRRMSYGRTAKQLMDALSSGKRPKRRPEPRWWNYVEDLAWSCFRIPAAKLPLVAGDRDPWKS